MQDDFRPFGPVKSATELKQTSPTNNTPEPAPTFQTPDQIREHDGPIPVSAVVATETDHKKLRGTGHHWFNLPWPPNKEEIILIAVVVLMAGFGVVGYAKLHKTPANQAVVHIKTAKKVVPVQPTTVPSSLSGLPVSVDVNQRPVVGAMIENSLAARPQAGLSQAGVVFEAIAEGGITRYLALFQDQQPGSIGPVRSARPYYVSWNEGFRAAYAHVGGSPDALADIKSWGVQDLNQFYNAGAYHRISSRSSPHNTYASVVDLAQLASQKNFKSTFTGFSRKVAAPAKQATATSLDFTISGPLYNPHYAYDVASNTYLRSENGGPQLDSNTGKQLAPNVVVAIVVPLSAGALDASGARYSNYNPIGTGTAYVFQDGTATVGTWSKASNTAQISFTDASGAAIKFDPGQTWISAVASGSKVVYK